MAVIAALQSTALSPQVASETIDNSAGNAIRPTPTAVTVIAAPQPGAVSTQPKPSGHAVG